MGSGEPVSVRWKLSMVADSSASNQWRVSRADLDTTMRLEWLFHEGICFSGFGIQLGWSPTKFKVPEPFQLPPRVFQMGPGTFKSGMVSYRGEPVTLKAIKTMDVPEPLGADASANWPTYDTRMQARDKGQVGGSAVKLCGREANLSSRRSSL